MGGYYTAVTGNTITAANWNTYVRDQTANVFATASARTAAITAPTEGMVSYLSDTDTLWYYSGSAWKPVGWQLIGTNTLGVAASQQLFSSIPTDYTHLMLMVAGRSSSAVNGDNVKIQFNADTGNNYTTVDWSATNTVSGGTGSVGYTATASTSSALGPDIPGTLLGDSRQGGMAVFEVPHYTNSVYGKHVSSRGAACIGASAWSTTNRWSGWFVATAISSIRVFLGSGGNFQASSRFDLYGIA